MRLVIELRRGENAEVMLNNLYRLTSMETVFGINLVALVDGQPRLLGIREMIEAFVRHRREVVTRRTIFELRKARERAHVLEGLAVALANIEAVIELIGRPPTPPRPGNGSSRATGSRIGTRDARSRRRRHVEARRSTRRLRARGTDRRIRVSHERDAGPGDTRPSPAPPHRAGGRTRSSRSSTISSTGSADCSRFSSIRDRLREVVRGELLKVKEQFADARRTEIELHREGMDILHLIKPQDVVVTMFAPRLREVAAAR